MGSFGDTRIDMRILYIQRIQFHKETHNFVATAVDETLATFGANLSENFNE